MADQTSAHIFASMSLADTHREIEQGRGQLVELHQEIHRIGLEREARAQELAAIEQDIQRRSNAYNELSVKHHAMGKEVEAFEASPPAVKRRLDGEIAEREQRIEALKREEQELSNSIASKGAEYLDLKERRKKFVLEDIDA
jgi:chromosome segregation ATPase